MSDVYIYHFIEPHGPNGKKSLSARPGTLEAIKGRGEAVMESQIVVDHTELDGDGFLVAAVGNDSSTMDSIVAQIRSFEVRAASRDNEAIDSTDHDEKYMLRLESRELRKQARYLKSRRAELVAGELSYPIETKEFMQFGTMGFTPDIVPSPKGGHFRTSEYSGNSLQHVRESGYPVSACCCLLPNSPDPGARQ